MSYNLIPKCVDVEIYYDDGTSQKYFNVEWSGGNSQYIVLSKDKKTWYIMKAHIKYIMREEVEPQDERSFDL